jgi:hypothetical protein
MPDMRILNLIGLLAALCGSAFAQSTQFLPFDQSKAQVRSYLEAERENTRSIIQEKPDMGTILAIMGEDRQVEYAFKRDRLYAITVIQNYTNNAQAATRRKECLSYMRSVGADSLEEKSYGQIVCYTGITNERVMKLFVRRQEDNSFTLTFSSIQARYFDKRSGENKFFYEIDLLTQYMALRGKP